jgi:hypothetical protein
MQFELEIPFIRPGRKEMNLIIVRLKNHRLQSHQKISTMILIGYGIIVRPPKGREPAFFKITLTQFEFLRIPEDENKLGENSVKIRK